jgi:sulfur-oxidizing protein SoxA
MQGVATRYPAYDRVTGRLLNLEERINLCRTEQQGAPPLAYESEELLALTAYVAYQSRGLPVAVAIDGPERPYFEHGRDLYTRRIGQMNLACTHCHDQRWGQRLLSEIISQGHGNAYPVYRLEWQTLGSLQRRLRSCYSGVRAQVRPYGDADYLALELYLAWRSQGLTIETPGVRR